MDKFKQLKLSEGLLRAIKEANFKEPSKIQEESIPLILEGKDVLASSATGSGKTLAFGAGIIEKTQRGAGIQALILTPTRELAEQVAKSLRAFSHYHGLVVTEVYGGVSIGPQINHLTRSDIVVGTPGRILDHLKRKTLNLSKVRFLVLDEADRMLDMGFIEDVETIIKACPKERQTLLFSATIYPEIEKIARSHMKNATHIEVEQYVDPSKLQQIFYDVPTNMKFSLLAFLLKQEGGLVMVFCNTRRNTNNLAKNLARYHIEALAIHGGLSQNKRNYVMRAFHSQKSLILVCTDVAARGLDIKDVSHVYNYDIPSTSKEYVHRIGRTARAGKEGKAISLVSSRDYENFRKVTTDTSFKIEHVQLPQFDFLAVNFNVEKKDFGYKRHNSSFRQRPGGSRREYNFGRGNRDAGRGNRNFRRDGRSQRPRMYAGTRSRF